MINSIQRKLNRMLFLSLQKNLSREQKSELMAYEKSISPKTLSDPIFCGWLYNNTFISEKTQQLLEQQYWQNIVHEKKMLQKTIEIIDVANQAKLPIAIYKGMYFSIFKKFNKGVRYSKDIDILVDSASSAKKLAHLLISQKQYRPLFFRKKVLGIFFPLTIFKGSLDLHKNNIPIEIHQIKKPRSAGFMNTMLPPYKVRFKDYVEEKRYMHKCFCILNPERHFFSIVIHFFKHLYLDLNHQYSSKTISITHLFRLSLDLSIIIKQKTFTWEALVKIFKENTKIHIRLYTLNSRILLYFIFLYLEQITIVTPPPNDIKHIIQKHISPKTKQEITKMIKDIITGKNSCNLSVFLINNKLLNFQRMCYKFLLKLTNARNL